MTYIVVGCGNVGFETVKLLASSKNAVYVLNRSFPKYLEEYISKSESNITYLPVDINKWDTVRMSMNKIRNEVSAIDGLIITAGVRASETCFEEMQAFSQKLITNSVCNLYPAEYAVKIGLLKEKAAIVVVSSTSGHFVRPGMIAYTPAKWGLESALIDLRNFYSQNISIIAPRTIRNNYSKEFLTNHGVEPENVARVILKVILSSKSKLCFVPWYYRAIDLVEKYLPEAFNVAFGIKLKWMRRGMYSKRSYSKVVVIGSDYPLTNEITEKYRLIVDEVYRFDSYSAAMKAWPGSVDAIFNGAHLEAFSSSDEVSEACKTAMEQYVINFAEYLKFLHSNSFPSCIVNIMPKYSDIKSIREIGERMSIKAVFALTRAMRRKMGNSVQIVEAYVKNDSPKMAGDVAEKLIKAVLSGKEIVKI